jgi:hypothetical protein
MNPSEHFVITRLGRALRCHGEPLRRDLLMQSDGCFVEECAEPVEWAGWWYCESGARHLTESCGEHSDHLDFTPVTRFADGHSRVRLF